MLLHACILGKQNDSQNSEQSVQQTTVNHRQGSNVAHCTGNSFETTPLTAEGRSLERGYLKLQHKVINWFKRVRAKLLTVKVQEQPWISKRGG